MLVGVQEGNGSLGWAGTLERLQTATMGPQRRWWPGWGVSGRRGLRAGLWAGRLGTLSLSSSS